MNIPFTIGLGILAGMMAGIFGIGGGIVLVPVLIFGFGFTQFQANGTSLVALLLPVGALGAWEYYSSGKITGTEVKVGFVIAIGMFVGTLLGSKIAVSLPENVLRRAFAVFLVLVATKLWFFSK